MDTFRTTYANLADHSADSRFDKKPPNVIKLQHSAVGTISPSYVTQPDIYIYAVAYQSVNHYPLSSWTRLLIK